MISLATAIGAAAVDVASASQSVYGGAKSGVEISYDDAQWQATELATYPYFTCIAPDCDSATCLVITSLDPTFAKWPETIDKASLAALDDIFLKYEKSGGHEEAELVEPESLLTIGGRQTLVSTIRMKMAGDGYLSSKYMFRDAGDTRIVTCEGDEKSITASKARIETLIGAIQFVPQ
jgi:hypothetical protein